MDIQIFQNPEFGQIRTMVMPDGQIGFVGKDVASVLGYADPQKAIKTHVDEEDKLTRQIVVSGQNRNVYVINESGLYSLILSSKLPKAREFKHWVTSEVLPQIRRTGGYIPIQQDDDEKTILSKALLILKNTLEQKDALLEAQRPKVQFAEAVISSDGSILIRDLAKLLTQNGITIGQNRLFRWLRQHGYLFQHDTRPIQIWVERGIFDTNITLVQIHHGTKEVCTTRVTGKGQHYFINGFLNGSFIS